MRRPTHKCMPHPDAEPPTRLSYFSKRLAKQTLQNAVDADGKPGDCYFFLGDIWHARRPNLQGKNGMVLLAGAFPVEFKFPEPVQNLAMLSQKEWIFENRSAAYKEIYEQRIAENPRFMASIVRDFEQALRLI